MNPLLDRIHVSSHKKAPKNDKKPYAQNTDGLSSTHYKVELKDCQFVGVFLLFANYLGSSPQP